MFNVERDGAREEPNAILMVTTTEDGPVSFTVTRIVDDETVSSSHVATRGVSTVINFPADEVYVTRVNQRDKYILVQAEANKTISMYGVNDEHRSTDGFVALSCDGMSVGYTFRRYEYAIVSGDIRATPQIPPTSSQFLIIPCEDDSTIEITPSQIVTVGGFRTQQFGVGTSRATGVWQDVFGNRPKAGETLLITSSSDLTGTIISSNKPIAVFAGHQCAQVPVGRTACDHLVEQIPPSTSWGYTFLLNPLAVRESGDIYRVVSIYDDTEVSVTCVNEGDDNFQTESLATLSRAQRSNWLEYSTRGSNTESCAHRRFCSLQSTKPVLVAQYSQGYSVDVGCITSAAEVGDPFMSIISPIVQYQNDYLITSFIASAGPFPSRFVSVSVYKDFFQPNLIMLNDTTFEPDSSKWNRIYCSDGEVCGYGLYKEIERGNHRLYHSNPNAGISIQFYGYQQQNSFGFPAGMELEPLSGRLRCFWP